MDAYKREIKDAIIYAKELKFDKTHPWHHNLVALYCAIIEYSDSLVFLIDNEKGIAVPVIFRGLLEAYVDFKNLAEQRTYGYFMEASYTKEWLKILNEENLAENAYLADIAADPGLVEEIQKHRDKLGELKEKGYSPLSHFQKFEKAEMLEEYRSVYNFVCSYSHNNIRSLVDRFLIINEAEKDFQMALFRDQEPKEFEQYIQTGRHLIRNCSHNIHAILETGHEGAFSVAEV